MLCSFLKITTVRNIIEKDIKELDRLATTSEDAEISNSIRISYIEDTPLLYAARYHRVEISITLYRRALILLIHMISMYL